MNLEVTLPNILLMIFSTFCFSVILVPVFKKLAYHVGALDYPSPHHYSSKEPVPTTGGLAVFCSFLLGYMLFGRANVQMLSILIASFILLMVGFIDNIKSLSAKYQLLGQLIAVCVIIFYGHITIDNFTVLGLNLVFPVPFNYLVTILFMLGIINAIDLSDGMDGLSSGISMIYFVTIITIAMFLNLAGNLDFMIAVLMIGSLLGFWIYNLPPAKIYIGNSGSNFEGLMIATTALYGYKLATFTSLIIPLAILATPIIDVFFSIVRRSLKKENPFTTPDTDHLHHQLLKMKFSKRSSLAIIYLINIGFSFASILYALGHIKYAIIIYITLMVIFLFIVLKTEILFPNMRRTKHEK